jgi:hypothetical protein
LADMRIPTDTEITFRNLPWYAQRINYTVNELLDEAIKDGENNKWDKDAVKSILKRYKQTNITNATNNYDWDTDFEKLASLMKQDGSLTGNDAAPAIPLYHFYFQDTDKKWYLRIVPETNTVKGDAGEVFLWESKDPVADSWKELIHCQYGDLSFDVPQKFHSVRGLASILYEPIFYTNLTRCRLLQHVNDNFNILLRVTDPPDKARAAIQEFSNLGVLRSGVSVVPQNERHQIAAGLVETAMAQLKQLMGEASSSYTQQADNGTQKERTAFETRVNAEQVNQMTAGIILRASKFERQASREMCRRFCKADSEDEDVKDFQEKCEAYGIPKDLLNIKYWKVRQVVPIGMGNPTIAQAEIQQLQQLAPKLDAQAQREINHSSVLTITRDPEKASRWVPLNDKTRQSDAKKEAIGLFATLLVSAPGSVPPPDSNYMDQIDVLMPILAGKVMLYTQRNNMATPEEAMGLKNALTYVSQAIQALSADPAQKVRTKQYTDSLAKLDNEIKGLEQRGLQAAEAQAKQQEDGKMQEAQEKMQIMKAETATRLHLEEQKFKADERRKDLATAAEIRRKNAATFAKTEQDKFSAMAKAHTASMKVGKEPE